MNAEVVILDEPTTGLRIYGNPNPCWIFNQTSQNTKVTPLFFSTHHLDEVDEIMWQSGR